MSIHSLKRGFTSGEISEELIARTDNKAYDFGALELKNMIVKPQGPIRRREGTKLIYDLGIKAKIPAMDPNDEARPRFVPFIFSDQQSYALLFVKNQATTKVDVHVFYNGAPLLTPAFSISGVFDIRNFQYAQSGDILTIVQSGRSPIEIHRTSHTAWSVNAISFTNQPAEWSDANGWPTTVSYYEQRIVYAGTNYRPQTLWFSKSGDFTDFGTSSPQLVSDAVTFTLDSGKQDRIKWLSSTSALIIGTLASEWSISGIGAPLSYASVRATKHTSIGGTAIPPLQINNFTLFVSKAGTEVTQLAYDFNFNGYTASNLMILSQHLTEFRKTYSSVAYATPEPRNRIIDWTYAQAPDRLIWAIRADGTFLACTFEREHNVVAWAPQETTGNVVSVTSIPNPEGQYKTYLAVVRDMGDAGLRLCIEVMYEELTTDCTYEQDLQPFTLDFAGRLAVLVSSQLGQYAGLTDMANILVHGVSDKYILENIPVMPAHVVTGPPNWLTVPVPRNYDTFDPNEVALWVGFNFENRITPTTPDVPDGRGSTLTEHRRLLNLEIIFLKAFSLTIEYNNDGVFSEDISFLDPRYPDAAQPNFKGIRVIEVPVGYQRGAKYTLVNSLPGDFSIAGLTEVYEVEDRA